MLLIAGRSLSLSRLFSNSTYMTRVTSSDFRVAGFPRFRGGPLKPGTCSLARRRRAVHSLSPGHGADRRAAGADRLSIAQIRRPQHHGVGRSGRSLSEQSQRLDLARLAGGGTAGHAEEALLRRTPIPTKSGSGSV
jgi:hypothetical protein